MDHHLDRAWWLWFEEFCLNPVNRYGQFVRTFTLIDVAPLARVFVTADQAYQLYINGVYIGRGPARGYQASWPYDSFEVAEFLREGQNTIAAVVHNPGTGTFSYRHEGVAGFLFTGQFGKTEIVSDASWRCRADPARATHTPKLSKQMGFQEHIDLRRDDRSWMTAGAHDGVEGWRKPSLRRYGCPPWHTTEPRNLPPLSRDEIPYTEFVARATWRERPCDTGTLRNPMTHHRDAIAAAEWQPPDSGWGADDVGVLIVPEVPDGSCYALTVGLSLPGVGEVLIEADGCQGGEVLDVLYAETIDGFGRPVFANTLSPGGDAVDVCTSVVLGGGGCRHEAFQITGHRYATVVVTGPSPALRLRLMHRQTRYPLDIVGRFDCDDPALMQTYHVSVNTQRNCMLDAYVDTPWREQAQWWGDARVQAWNTFSLKDDPRLLQRGIRQIADPQQSVPNGLTYGHAPTIAHNCVLPDFTCVWILTVWDHFFQTGEPNVFLEQAARIDSAIGYFESFGIGQGNLAAADPRYWLFLDWTDGIPREGQPTLLNMMLLEALERVGSLVQVSGYRGPLERVETLAQTLRGTITDRLWDEEVGAFHDGLGEQGQPYRSWSLHSQVQAVLCSLRSDVHEKTAREWVGAYLSGGPSGAAVPTPFWLVYVYEAARRLGLAQEAVDHMASYYAPMVASCGTWERSDRPGNGDVTGSHAWSAHPIYHLPRLLGGIVQLEPGWSKIRFDPLVNVKRCRRVSTLVPTPRGSIASTWERDGSRVNVRLELPTGIEAEAVLTGQRTEVVIGVSNWCVELSGTGVNTP